MVSTQEATYYIGALGPPAPIGCRPCRVRRLGGWPRLVSLCGLCGLAPNRPCPLNRFTGIFGSDNSGIGRLRDAELNFELGADPNLEFSLQQNQECILQNLLNLWKLNSTHNSYLHYPLQTVSTHWTRHVSICLTYKDYHQSLPSNY